MKVWPYFAGSWFILFGLESIIKLSFQYQGLLMGILALVAGVLMIIRK